MVIKYLITGGCGFIGSHLAEALVGRGFAVRILDDLSTGKRENAPEKAELLIGSITDPLLLERALQGVDGVFHLAAVASIQKSIDQWSAVHEVNSAGCIRLYEALSKLKKSIPLVYASSSAIYGDSPQIPLKEETFSPPLSPYGIDKLAGEWQAGVLGNVFHVQNTSFRFFNVFGPREDPSSPYSGVISIFAKRISEGKPLMIYGDGEQVRDFIYVKDVARMLVETMVRPMTGTHIYNLCSGTGTTVNQLADLMGKIACTSIKKEYAPSREGEIRISIGDPTKLKNSLQLEPIYSLEEGLKELLKTCASSFHS